MKGFNDMSLPVLSCEYRGHLVETRQVADKLSGKISNMATLTLNVEFGATGKGLSLKVYDGQDSRIRHLEEKLATVKKGDLLQVAVMKWISEKGLLIAMADDLEKVKPIKV